jgi:hypothetical protein
MVPPTMPDFKFKVQQLEEYEDLNDLNIITIDIGGGTVKKGFGFLLGELVDKKI